MNSFPCFPIRCLAGDPKTALKEPNNIILSESLAQENICCHEITIFLHCSEKRCRYRSDSLPYKITGICKDVSENSHLQFDLLVSYITLYEQKNPYKEAEYDCHGFRFLALPAT